MSDLILDVFHSYQSICPAPGLISMRYASDSVFVKSPTLELSYEQNCTNFAGVKVSLALSQKKSSLSDKLKITQVVRPDDSGPGGRVVLEQNRVEIVVRPWAEVTDNQGKVIPDMKGWKMSFIAEDFALFSNSHEDASFYLRKPW